MPQLNLSNNKSPLWFRKLIRVSVPRLSPAHSSPQGRSAPGHHHSKAPYTTAESPKIVHLVPQKETSEEKGAKLIAECKPDGLDMEFYSRLKHLGTTATRRGFPMPWLKGK